MDNVVVEYDIRNYVDSESELDDFTKCQILGETLAANCGFQVPLFYSQQKGAG